MNTPEIVASVLGADYARLGGEVLDLVAAGVDRIQWDVMDGRFVPNLTFGADVIGSCRSYAELPFEAHLMIADPDAVLSDYVTAGCETIIVHVEACPHLHRTISRLHDLGAAAGVAVNPSTSLDFLEHVLEEVDHVLVMTVNPGFGGQRYIAAMERKVAEARDLVRASGRPIRIEVDGGISADTAAGARAAGADLFVAGSALLRHPSGKRTATDDLRRVLTDADRTTTVRKVEVPMMGEASTLRLSQDRLLRQAAGVIRSRYRCGRGYPGLAPDVAERLCEALDTEAAGGRPVAGSDREEAVALAHRVVDDDHPELSPLWARASNQL